MSVDYSEFIEFRDKFERLSNEFENFLKQFLIKQALDVLAKTKKESPTDTGLLKNSWTIGNQGVAIRSKTLKSGKNKGKIRYYSVESAFVNNTSIDNVERDGDVLKVTISNPVEYAKYVEYGHMDRSHQKWINGQFMCSLSIIDVKKKMPKRFQKEFEAWFASFNM